MAISLKFYIVLILITAFSPVIYNFTVARVSRQETRSFGRNEREAIAGRRKCPKGKIWYYVQCRSIKELQDYGDIADSSESDALQNGKSKSKDILESNETLLILPLLPPKSKHSDTTVKNSTATFIKPTTSFILTRLTSRVNLTSVVTNTVTATYVVTEPLSVLGLLHSKEKQPVSGVTKEISIDSLPTLLQPKVVSASTQTVTYTEPMTSETGHSATELTSKGKQSFVDMTKETDIDLLTTEPKSKFAASSTQTVTMAYTAPMSSEIVQMVTHTNVDTAELTPKEKQPVIDETKDTSEDSLSTLSESTFEASTQTLTITEPMTSETRNMATYTNIDTTELTLAETESLQTTTFVRRKETHTRSSGTHFRNEYMANILGETQSLVFLLLLVGCCVALLDWLYERMYSTFCRRRPEDNEEVPLQTISTQIKH